MKIFNLINYLIDICESCQGTIIYNLHDATIKTQDAHETYEHTQQVANVTHQYGYNHFFAWGWGANFCHLVTKTNSNVSSMMDFVRKKIQKAPNFEDFFFSEITIFRQ